MLAHELRLGMDQRHHVLQLIAEAEGAARLVVAAARPKPAGQGLVQEPAVGQHVERLVGCVHIDRAQRVVPVLPHRFERARAGGRSAKALDQVAGVVGVPPHAEHEDDLALLPVGQFELDLDRGAGIQGRADACRTGAYASMAAGVRSVPLRPRNSVAVAGHGASRFV